MFGRRYPPNGFDPRHRIGYCFPPDSGEVAEWLNAPVSKTGLPARVAGVRISPSPYPPNRPLLPQRAALSLEPPPSTDIPPVSEPPPRFPRSPAHARLIRQ